MPEWQQWANPSSVCRDQGELWSRLGAGPMEPQITTVVVEG